MWAASASVPRRLNSSKSLISWQTINTKHSVTFHRIDWDGGNRCRARTEATATRLIHSHAVRLVATRRSLLWLRSLTVLLTSTMSRGSTACEADYFKDALLKNSIRQKIQMVRLKAFQEISQVWTSSNLTFLKNKLAISTVPLPSILMKNTNLRLHGKLGKTTPLLSSFRTVGSFLERWNDARARDSARSVDSAIDRTWATITSKLVRDRARASSLGSKRLFWKETSSGRQYSRGYFQQKHSMRMAW